MGLNDLKIAIVGLGYDGLPLAVEFGKKRPVVGFDIIESRIAELCSGCDHTLETDGDVFKAARLLSFSAKLDDLDGETSRDFCFIANTVQSNLLAETTRNPDAINQIYNIALGDRTTLNALFDALRAALAGAGMTYARKPVYRAFRVGDERHSQANVGKAQRVLVNLPEKRVASGIAQAMPRYTNNLQERTQ